MSDEHEQADSLEPLAGELYVKAKAGDATARNDLIAMFLDFIPRIVASFVGKRYRYRYLADELESFCNLELVKIIDVILAATKRRESIQATVIHSLKMGIIEEAGLLACPVSLSANTLRRRRAKKEHVAKARDIEPRKYSLEDKRSRRLRVVRDIIAEGCYDKRDEAIVSLRAAGHTDDEIGRLIGLHGKTVRLKRAAIRERYDQRMAYLPPLKALGA